jgi:hypothetical protein
VYRSSKRGLPLRLGELDWQIIKEARQEFKLSEQTMLAYRDGSKFEKKTSAKYASNKEPDTFPLLSYSAMEQDGKKYGSSRLFGMQNIANFRIRTRSDLHSEQFEQIRLIWLEALQNALT